MAHKAAGRTFAQDIMRGEHTVGQPTPAVEDASYGTSIFDPVLCELAYRWFCPPGGHVIDPFAGGSVRGIVAAWLGRPYTGIDLRPEQVKENEAQWAAIRSDKEAPRWLVGDAIDITDLVKDQAADFIFTCPPYGDLERYSDDPRDLSTMDYGAFIDAYRKIIQRACLKLRNDRFACIVVGDYRDSAGFYRNFPGETVAAFIDAGMALYNEAILVTAAGSLPLRTGKQFEASRKLGKTHQQVYVFCKGNPARATKAIGAVEFGEASATDPDAAEADPDAAYGTRL